MLGKSGLKNHSKKKNSVL